MSENFDLVFDKLTNNITDKEHYLIKQSASQHIYWEAFRNVAKLFYNYMTKNDFNDWCKNKMLIKDHKFECKTFIQSAVETAVCNFFLNKYPESTCFEAKVNPNNKKDVDVRVIEGDYTFNVEVKCAKYSNKEKIDSKEGFKFVASGRIPNRNDIYKEISNAMDQGLANNNQPKGVYYEAKNMDNNLKDFLESAHKKFNPISSDKEVNILFVGCNDCHDIENWFHYLYAYQGLFTNESFADNNKYSNVDLVVFSNLYYKHHDYFNKNIEAHWSLEKKSTFSLIFCNPFRKNDKKDAIMKFNEIFPNYSNELCKYQVPGPADDYINNTMKITYFVKDELEKKRGIHLFK